MFSTKLQPAAHTRRSNGSTVDATFDGVLTCFSNNIGTKSIIKKIGADVVQLLLAHGFQVTNCLHSTNQCTISIESNDMHKVIGMTKNSITA